MKSPKKTTPAEAPKRPEVGTPVTLRVRPEQLIRLDAYAESKGIARASAIQITIAELLERNAKL